MARHLLPSAALIALVACSGPALVKSASSSSGSVDDAQQGGTETPTPTPATITVPATLAVNMSSFTYDPDNETLQVAIEGLDSTSTGDAALVTYTRNPTLDTGVYQAYSVQEDALDRIFVALAATSEDGSVTGVTAGDGGQFSKYFAGGLYARKGDFTPPTVGDGPGKGQVSYAGDYAAVTNIPVQRISPTSIGAAVDSSTPEALMPYQPMRVAGKTFLNVNFQDNSVNGSIYDRNMIDTMDGVPVRLETVYLTPADIASDGTFSGGTARRDSAGTGAYGGIFGGTDANSVAGLVHLEASQVYLAGSNPDTASGTQIDNAQEHGVFVLTQCGANNTSAVCSAVAPSLP